jgi:hypothetical protein
VVALGCCRDAPHIWLNANRSGERRYGTRATVRTDAPAANSSSATAASSQ